MKTINRKNETSYQHQLYNLLNRKEYEKLAETSEEKKNENIAMNIKKQKEFVEYERKVSDTSKHLEFIRDRHLPKFVPFVNLEDLQEQQEENQ